VLSRVWKPPMRDKWEETDLQSVCGGDGLIQTGPFGSQLHMSDYTVVGVPVIMPTNIGDGCVTEQGIMRTSPEKAATLGRHRVRAGDIVYSRRGDITKRALVVPREAGWLCGTGCLLVRSSKRVDPRWLSYWLGQPLIHRWLTNQSVGATMANLNTEILSRLPVSLPPMSEQRSIAAALGAFDQLIETNRTLATDSRRLAQAASRAILQQAGDWDSPLPQVADIAKGFSYRSTELISNSEMHLLNLKNMGRGGTFRFDGYKPLRTSRHKPGQVVDDGDIVVSLTDLTQDRDIIARAVRVQRRGLAGPIVASLDLAVVRPLPGASREFIWSVLAHPRFRDHADGYCNGTTVLHMKEAALREFLVPSPTPVVLERLDESVRPLLECADVLDTEADELARQRDALLPLLMSGEVTLSGLPKIA
jgi:type I restriction enzyme, S subunit